MTTTEIISSLEVLDINTGEKVETVNIPENIQKYFEYKNNAKALLHELVVAYQANQRQGTHSTKTRAEVKGGGKKPWRQKHTGRARAGSIRSPLWRKGGITFGPKPRDYYITIPKQKKIIGKYLSIVDKIRSNNCIVVNSLDISSYKTKEFMKILKNLKVDSKKVLLIPKEVSKNLKLASRNLSEISLSRITDLNAYDILNCEKIIITKEALLCL